MKSELIVVVVVLALIVGAGVGFSGIAGNAATRTETMTTTSFATATSTITSSAVTTVTSTSTITSSAVTTLTATETFLVNSTLGQLGPWVNSTAYPGSNGPSSCVVAQAAIYCVTENGNATYFAPITSNGVGQWKRGSDYPISINSESCMGSGGYIYCVGGVSQSTSTLSTDKYGRTAEVFYAPISGSGIGPWVQTTSYPYIIASPRCATWLSTIYCIEDSFSGSGYAPPAEAYYAQLSANGVGAWIKTSGPPSLGAGCSAGGGDIYCFGGGGCSPSGPNGDCYSPSYFAPLSASGIGSWSRTTDLPTAGFANYVTSGPYVYYLSVPVFYAPVSSRGIGAWVATTNLPASASSVCASSGAYLYCPGGNSMYYSQVGAPNPNAFVLLNPPPYLRAVYLGPAWSGSGGCSESVGGVTEGAPCFGLNIDNAVIFDCAAAAATSSGCLATVVSPADTAYNYNMTIWYPHTNSSFPETNCAFRPSLDTNSQYGWCISISPSAFIIAQQVFMQSAQP